MMSTSLPMRCITVAVTTEGSVLPSLPFLMTFALGLREYMEVVSPIAPSMMTGIISMSTRTLPL